MRARIRLVVARADRLQRRHGVLGFPLAVRKKYADDQGGALAATIAYYAFFSLFPLLLVFVTALGYLLPGDPGLRRRIVDSALGQLPVIGRELASHSLKGNGAALALGIVVSLWTGTGVLLAVAQALQRIWEVPEKARLGFVASHLRALVLLLVIGTTLLVVAVLSGAATGSGRFATEERVGAVLVALAVDVLLFWTTFALLSGEDTGWREMRGGAVAAAVGYEALQLLGSYYVTHTLRRASDVYGTFALVIGILSWVYLTATVVLLAAEGNVVARRRLWPRPLAGDDSRPDDSKHR